MQNFSLLQSCTLQVQKVLFNRINNHLLFHWHPLIQFWTTNRLCVTLQEFQQMLAKIGFKNAKSELEQLKQQHIQFIQLDKLLQSVNEWKRNDKDILTFLQKQKQYQKLRNAQKQSKKVNSKLKFQNIQSPSKQPPSNKSERTNKQTNDSIICVNKIISNRQKQLLKAASIKQQTAVKNLNSTLIRTKNQSNYQLTIKLGQCNDICKKLKNNLSYLVIAKNGQIQIIERSEKNDQQRKISMKMFQRKYHQLKTANNNTLEQIQGTLQKDLRQTMVQVMFLSDQLQKQIALLKRKGVNA